jgi:hypothetical protein
MAFTDPPAGPGTAATVGGIGTGCLYFILVMFPVLVIAGLGHCDPRPCPPNNMVGMSALKALGPALLLGLALRSLLFWLGQQIRAQEPGAAPYAGPTPWWTFIAVPLAIVGGWWLVWGWGS